MKIPGADVGGFFVYNFIFSLVSFSAFAKATLGTHFLSEHLSGIVLGHT